MQTTKLRKDGSGWYVEFQFDYCGRIVTKRLSHDNVDEHDDFHDTIEDIEKEIDEQRARLEEFKKTG
jgi:hypothetical protein